jgi:hypothetical protein
MPLTDAQRKYLNRFTSLEQDVEEIIRAAFRVRNANSPRSQDRMSEALEMLEHACDKAAR